MDLTQAISDWQSQGFAVLPGYLPDEALGPAVAELEVMFPSAEGFHSGRDPRRGRFVGDEFAGIDSFPFASTKISLLAVHDRLVRLARTLLRSDNLRLYTAEAWAKYTGANDYDQELHRDYLNHTLVVPTHGIEQQQVEMFVYLVDVPEELGPPHLVPTGQTANLPAKPNWYPRQADASGSSDAPEGFLASARPELYEREVSAAGPAGTVVAFQLGTFHRGTALTRSDGARYTMHLGFRHAEAEWSDRKGWADRSHDPAWYRFVEHASPAQLELFGFPPPGHSYWTPATLDGAALRYPGLDLSPWRSRLDAAVRAPSRGSR
ncbi:phytanoyl-CoA dioxygenase family protein [Actinomadura chokoriensis]|uniref:phytanoyl-CoA dioxygenase family protein n=1 Tax=Actinomadura chokoriensis TaxID=454156 RepID=UPI0031FA2EDC